MARVTTLPMRNFGSSRLPSMGTSKTIFPSRSFKIATASRTGNEMTMLSTALRVASLEEIIALLVARM